MIFKRKKPKLDSKVRFQHQQFTRKLDKARQFKRVARSIPENKFDLALSRVGLGSRWMQLLAALVLLGALYIVYVPNFLSVQTVLVKGLSDSDTAVAEASVRQTIANTPFYNPQHNLLFLSEKRVSKALLDNPKVFQVNSISKDFATKSVVIEVTPKYERFLLADRERVFDIYNDGSLKGSAGLSREQWDAEVNPGMIKIRVDGKVELRDESSGLQPSLRDALEIVAGKASHIPGATFLTALLTDPLPPELPEGTVLPTLTTPLVADELRLVLLKGGDRNRPFVAVFDGHSDINSAMDRLIVLLSQTNPERYNNISYIDLRIPDRGYICLRNTPCDS